MDRALAVRALALYGPAMLVGLPWALRSPPARRGAAALLATAWSLPALLLVNVLATQLGWWTFAPARASILGVQVELLLGWMLLWGAAPVVLLHRLPLAAVVGLLALVDLILMPLTAPVVRLGDAWLVGEAVALAVVLVPAQLLARWTENQRNVNGRATLQAIAFTGLVLWVLPAVIIERGFASWTPLIEGWNRYGGLHLQLAMLPAVIGLSAVQEFATRGARHAASVRSAATPGDVRAIRVRGQSDAARDVPHPGRLGRDSPQRLDRRRRRDGRRVQHWTRGIGRARGPRSAVG